jgi:hypothetical protein
MAVQYREYTDPETTDQYRDGVRDGKWIIDKAITEKGFGTEANPGEEDVDWENIETTE